MKTKLLPIVLASLLFVTCKQNEPEETQPTASFTFTKNELKVTFTNTSKNAQSYIWDFGDGMTSKVINPVHTYSKAGTYSVSLKATNITKSDTYSQSIIISQANIIPTAKFSYKTAHPLKVVLTNTSTNATSYEWDFGDGNTSTEKNPTHRYNGIGVYKITLVAKSGSKSDIYQTNVTIEAPSTCIFSGVVFNKVPNYNYYYQIQLTDDYLFYKTTYLFTDWFLLSSANLPYPHTFSNPKTLNISSSYVLRLYKSSTKTSGQADGKGFWSTTVTSAKLKTFPESVTYYDSSASIIMNFQWK